MTKVGISNLFYFMSIFIFVLMALSVSFDLFIREKSFEWSMLLRGLSDGLTGLGAIVFIVVMLALVKG